MRRIPKYNSEHNLYEQIARYLQLQYPNVIYRFDIAADLKLLAKQQSIKDFTLLVVIRIYLSQSLNLERGTANHSASIWKLKQNQTHPIKKTVL